MTQEEQKVQELLKPRVIVENKWPGCDFEVGEILEEMPEADGYFNSEGHGLCKVDVIPYPYLMRPLHWWEERDASEMPEYVKSNKEVRELICLTMDGFKLKYDESKKGYRIGYFDAWLPATLAEYNAYISSPELK